MFEQLWGARSPQGDQGGFRGMISTALFEEAEMSERSDRAFFQTVALAVCAVR